MNFPLICYKKTKQKYGIPKYSRRKKFPPAFNMFAIEDQSSQTVNRKYKVCPSLLFRVFFDKRMLKTINKTTDGKVNRSKYTESEQFW